MYEFLTVANSYDFILSTVCSSRKSIDAFSTLCSVDLPFAARDLVSITSWHHGLTQWNVDQFP